MVKEIFERLELAFKFTKNLLAFVRHVCLICGTCGNISADIVQLITNVSIEFRVWTTELVNGLREVSKLVVDLSQSKLVEAGASLVFRYFVQMGESLLVQVLSVHDVCSFDHVLLFARFLLIDELLGFHKFTLLYKTDQFGMLGSFRSLTAVDFKNS